MADPEIGAEGGNYQGKPNPGAVFWLANHNLSQLHQVLHADVEKAFRDADEAAQAGQREDLERARRNAARVLFAWIEAMAWGMKRVALVFDKVASGGTFTAGEITVLQEKEYRLENNGKVIERNRFLSAEPNLRFAFDSFARAVRSSYRLQAHGSNWDTYRRAMKIRDRLMHPKESTQLRVSDDEYAGDLIQTWHWFNRVFSIMLASTATEGIPRDQQEGS